MAEIKLGTNTYELLLTTGATKAIAKRYGGLENLGDKLMQEENFAAAIEEVVWLLTLLANQALKRKQLLGEATEQKELCEADLEVLTTPSDLATFKDAITDCLNEGTKRVVENEPSKNENAS